MQLTIDNQLVGLADLREAWRRPVTVTLGNQAQRRIAESNELIGDFLASGAEVYGVTTGFGQFASVHIGHDELLHLQENLVRSHAMGIGEHLDEDVVRLIMLMKVIALAEGFSGVRLELVEALCALINHNIYPCIPSQGSVGASGDLAPLAHMASVLIGIGEARLGGNPGPCPRAASAARREPPTRARTGGHALLSVPPASAAPPLAAGFRTGNALSPGVAPAANT